MNRALKLLSNEMKRLCDAGQECCATGLNCNKQISELKELLTMCQCNCKDHSAPDYATPQDRKNALNGEIYALRLRLIVATKGSQEEHELKVKIDNLKTELKRIG